MSKIKSGLKSLFKIAENKVKGIEQHVSEEVKQQRLDICKNCPKRIAITNQCSECGCFLAVKTSYKQEECPLKHWLKVE